jgi:hypothetical protein
MHPWPLGSRLSNYFSNPKVCFRQFSLQRIAFKSINVYHTYHFPVNFRGCTQIFLRHLTITSFSRRLLVIYKALASLPIFKSVDISASTVATLRPDIYSAFSFPACHDTFIPNERLRALVTAYKSLPTDDQDVLEMELALRHNLKTILSWQSPEGGPESQITDSTLHAYLSAIHRRIKNGDETRVINKCASFKLKMAVDGSETGHRIETLRSSDILLGSEAKGTDKSSFAALIQCLQVCGDSALHLLERGLPRTLCTVPGVVTNGDCLQLCAVYLMPDSFPVITWLSPPLMIARLEDRIVLARWAVCLAKFAAETIDLLNTSPLVAPQPVHIVLGQKLFYKQMRDFDAPAELKPVNLGPGSTSHSRLGTMMRVYQQLLGVEGAEEYILFPCGIVGYPSVRADAYSRTIRLAIEKCQQKYFKGIAIDEFRPCVVFEHLNADDGWSINRPPSRLVPAYLERLRLAIDLLNTAEVAHMDLRPANILWKANTDESDVEMQIIDFETSVPFGIAINYPQRLRYDPRYPVLSTDERHVIPACPAHNTWFLRAITKWLEEDLTKDTFNDYMAMKWASIEDEFRNQLCPGRDHDSQD